MWRGFLQVFNRLSRLEDQLQRLCDGDHVTGDTDVTAIGDTDVAGIGDSDVTGIGDTDVTGIGGTDAINKRRLTSGDSDIWCVTTFNVNGCHDNGELSQFCQRNPASLIRPHSSYAMESGHSPLSLTHRERAPQQGCEWGNCSLDSGVGEASPSLLSPILLTPAHRQGSTDHCWKGTTQTRNTEERIQVSTVTIDCPQSRTTSAAPPNTDFPRATPTTDSTLHSESNILSFRISPLSSPRLQPRGVSVGARGGSVGSRGGSEGSRGVSVGSRGGSVGSRGGSVGLCGVSVGSRGGSVGSRVVSVGSRVVSVVSRGGSVGSRGGSVGSRDVSVGSRGGSEGSRGVSVGSRGGSVGSRDVSVGSKGLTPLSTRVTPATGPTVETPQYPAPNNTPGTSGLGVVNPTSRDRRPLRNIATPLIKPGHLIPVIQPADGNVRQQSKPSTRDRAGRRYQQPVMKFPGGWGPTGLEYRRHSAPSVPGCGPRRYPSGELEDILDTGPESRV